MSSIIKQNNKWLVRSGDNEWFFDSFLDAQWKANEETRKKLKKIEKPPKKITPK